MGKHYSLAWEADEQMTRLVDLETELEQSKNEAATLQERLRAAEERKSTLLTRTTETDGHQGSASMVSQEQLEAKDELIAPHTKLSLTSNQTGNLIER